jgi:integrase/recombinase XerD
MLASQTDQLLRLVPSAPLRDEVTAFLIDKEAQGLSKGIVRLYREKLSYFCNDLRQQGIHALLDITPNVVRCWLLQLAQTRNPGGIHANYRVLKAFLRWCWLEYEIEFFNPIAKVRSPKVPDQTLSPLPLDVLKAMLSVRPRKTFTDCRDKVILLVLLDAGCRASEFSSRGTKTRQGTQKVPGTLEVPGT